MPAAKRYQCGYCDTYVSSEKGWRYKPNSDYRIYICPGCEKATFFDGLHSRAKQTPAPIFGKPVQYVPKLVADLYNEARRCMSVSAYTAAVLVCRKILMNISVERGANPGQPFNAYVEYLAEAGFIPPRALEWVDHIRVSGNDATHKIQPMTQENAETLIFFVENLLRNIYEMPNRLPVPPPEQGSMQS